MNTKTKILFIEHDQNDLDLIQYELKKGGINYTAEIVQDGPAYELALKNFIPDIILSDYTLPSFDGLTAFKIKEKITPDTPFIFVSGTIGEENSIALINNGITDFVLKDKLFTLTTKVNRALKEAKENQRKVEAEQKLIQSESQLNRAQQLARMGSWERNFETGKVVWSAETYRIFNCDPETFILTADSLISLILPEDRKTMSNWIAACMSGINLGLLDYRINAPDGTIKYIQGQAEIIFNEAGKPIKAIGTVQDLTEKKKSEESKKFKAALLNTTSQAVIATDLNGIVNFWNKAAEEIYGWTAGEAVGKNIVELTPAQQTKEQGIEIMRELSHGHSWSGEFMVQRKDGQTFPAFVTDAPVFNEHNKLTGIIGVSYDITKSKNVEIKLLDSQAKWDSLVSNTTDIIFIISKDRLITYINNIPKSLIEKGLTIEKIIGQNYESLISPSYLQSVKKQIEKSLSDGVTTSFLMQGSVTHEYFEGIATPLLQEDKLQVLIIIMKDCTERIQAEEKILISEVKYRRLFEAVKDGILILNAKTGIIEDVNPFLEKKLGYSRSYFLGRQLWEIGFFKDILENKAAFEKLKKDKYIQYRDLPLETKDCRPLWVEFVSNVYDVSGKQVIQCNIRDITERKQAEEALSQSEVNLKAIFEDTLTGFLLLDSDFNIILFNNRSSELALLVFGKDLQKHISLVNMFPPERQQPLAHKLKQVLQGKEYNYESQFPQSNGSTVWVNLSSKPVSDSSGLIVGISFSIADISKRKEAEAELIQSEKSLKESQAIAHVGNWEVNFATNKVIWSDESCRIFGVSPEENQQTFESWLSFIHPEDLEHVKEEIKKSQASLSDSSFYNRICRRDGTIRYIFTVIKYKFNSEGKPIGLFGTAHDVTEQKIVEEKFKKSEIQIRNFAKHLNQVIEDERSSTAREIHDELGQQLVGIKIGLASLNKSNAHSLKTTGGEQSEKITGMMKDVDTTIQSMRKISTQLRPGILDTLGLIPSIQWLGSEFEKKTKIKCKMEISVTEQKFEKNISTCFFRICQEALTNISKHAGAHEVIISVSQNKNELMLKISDNGKGIVSEKLENPFSMGLLGMRERANIIGAELKIESKKGKGTTIQLNAKIN